MNEQALSDFVAALSVHPEWHVPAWRAQVELIMKTARHFGVHGTADSIEMCLREIDRLQSELDATKREVGPVLPILLQPKRSNEDGV